MMRILDVLRTRAARTVLLVASVAALGSAGCARAPRAADAVPAGTQRVLLVSLDGYRWDYVDRPGAVRVRELAARGVRAERMIPAFPSKTFPNHYTIVTGLIPEHHGIVANAMRDPELGLFRMNNAAAQRDPRWWGGEPIWVTAEKQGRRAAALFWPGSEAPIGGVAPTWWSPYRDDLPHADRIARVLEWLALPRDSAPAFIAMYFSDTDNAGHTYGPEAVETDSAIARVDRAIGTLVDGIARLGLTGEVNLIVVADHGMTATARDRIIVLDDYLDLATVEVVDWTPVAAIQSRTGNDEAVYRALRGAHPQLQVYRKGEVPPRFHFNAHPRITPIVAVADEGWTIASGAQIARWDSTGWTSGGAHGYDPDLPSMGAVFIAAGPGIAVGKRVPAFRNVHVYALMAELLGLRPAVTDGSLGATRDVRNR